MTNPFKQDDRNDKVIKSLETVHGMLDLWAISTSQQFGSTEGAGVLDLV